MLRRTVERFRTWRVTRPLAESFEGSRFYPTDSIGWLKFGIAIGIVLAGAVFWGITRIPHVPHTVPFWGDPDPPPELTASAEQGLLDRFQPILHFAPGEYWNPIPISAFLSDAVLKGDGPSDLTQPTEERQPTDETLPRGRGYGLDLKPCLAAEGVDCYEGIAPSLSTQPPVLYGRVWRNDTGAHKDIAYAIQYWVFYYFDDWRNSQTDPTIWQMHEGDWEDVTVGITRDDRPIYAAYSQHCKGAMRFWDNVSHEGDHPNVYVALGSHANYFTFGPHPIRMTCLGWAGSLARLEKPVDVAGENDPEGPDDAKVFRIDPAAPWVSFGGPWGEGQEIVTLDKRDKLHVQPWGTSPRGPAQTKLLWSNPVEETYSRWPEEK